MNKQPIIYSQYDTRWKSKPYQVPGETATIGGSGCGPSSAAMIIETMTGKKFTPEDACKWSKDHGYKALNAGTYLGYFKPQFAAFNIKCDMLNWTNTYNNPDHQNHKTVEKMLKEGYYFIALMGKGLWTSGGHFVVLWWQDDKMRINDPASTKPERLNGDIRTFRSQVKYYWWIDAREFNKSSAITVPADASTGAPQAAKGPSLNLKVGDIVEFTGSTHYYSANASKPSTCTPGKAKLTQIFAGLHPYQLIGVNSSVYGWVDEKDIKSPAHSAIDKLASLGVITSPDYWKTAVNSGKVKYLDMLLINASDKITAKGERCKTVEDAIANLVKAGVITSPDYWTTHNKDYASLDALICALGGSVSRP